MLPVLDKLRGVPRRLANSASASTPATAAPGSAVHVHTSDGALPPFVTRAVRGATSPEMSIA